MGIVKALLGRRERPRWPQCPACLMFVPQLCVQATDMGLCGFCPACCPGHPEKDDEDDEEAG